MNKLINNLRNINFKNLSSYQNIFRKFDSPEWKNYVSFDDNTYKKNLVFRNDNFELFVVCWKPKQKTPIHSHAENGCIIKMLKGNLTEKLYFNDGSFKKHTLYKNDITFIDDNIGKHIMENDSDKNAISMHLYSPPNYKI